MTYRACVIAFIAVAACTPSVSTTTFPSATADASRIAEDIKTVSSDAFMGRGPATAGETMATNYIRDRLIAAGVQPGGPNGSWFQEVPLLMSNITGTPSLSVTVNGQTISLTQGQEVAVRASMHQSPYAGIGYYESVVRRLGQGAVDGFMRLYTAPGVDHVGTGGPANVDMLGVLVDWVERAKAPAALQIVEQNAKPPFAITRARPLCGWPLVPRYLGGDAASAASFECRP